MTLVGTKKKKMMTGSRWLSGISFCYNYITLELLFYSLCTVFGGV